MEFLLFWAKLGVPCWRAFLVEHHNWVIHLTEFRLEFLLDHMLVVSFWYILLVDPSSCNLHEGTLVFFILLTRWKYFLFFKGPFSKGQFIVRLSNGSSNRSFESVRSVNETEAEIEADGIGAGMLFRACVAAP